METAGPRNLLELEHLDPVVFSWKLEQLEPPGTTGNPPPEITVINWNHWRNKIKFQSSPELQYFIGTYLSYTRTSFSGWPPRDELQNCTFTVKVKTDVSVVLLQCAPYEQSNHTYRNSYIFGLRPAVQQL